MIGANMRRAVDERLSQSYGNCVGLQILSLDLP